MCFNIRVQKHTLQLVLRLRFVLDSNYRDVRVNFWLQQKLDMQLFSFISFTFSLDNNSCNARRLCLQYTRVSKFSQPRFANKTLFPKTLEYFIYFLLIINRNIKLPIYKSWKYQNLALISYILKNAKVCQKPSRRYQILIFCTSYVTCVGLYMIEGLQTQKTPRNAFSGERPDLYTVI